MGAPSRARQGEPRSDSVSSDILVPSVPDAGVNTGSRNMALDAALEKLGQMDDRLRSVIELRFFGGLSINDTAEVLAVSRSTVIRDWRVAQAWLAREVGASELPS